MFYGTKFMREVISVFHRAGYVSSEAQNRIWPTLAYTFFEKEGKRLKKSPKEAALIAVATHFQFYSDISDYDKQGVYAAAWAIAKADPDPKIREIEDILLKLTSGIPLADDTSEIFFKIKER